MPKFSFKAKDKENNIIEGVEVADNKFDLAESLKSRGLTVINISLVAESGINKLYEFVLGFFYKISLTDKINFARNIGVMLGSGIALSRALEIELRQNKNKKLNFVFLDMINTVKSGGSFSKALENHSRVFPRFFQKMVIAGEKSGKLEESLKFVTLQLQKDYALRKKVRGAMVYPAIVLFTMMTVGVLMMIFVVPSLISTFKELNIELPISTSFIIFISNLIHESGLLFVSVLVVVLGAIFYFFKTEFGKKVLDYVFAHAPVIKDINKKFNAALLCRTLSSLIFSGVDIVESLEITKDLIANRLYRVILERALVSVKKGEAISKSFLSKESLFPPLVGEMMAVGEETGKIDAMLKDLAKFYETEVGSATKELSTVIEPILMIIIGVAVGFFAISMITPMYNLAGGL